MASIVAAARSAQSRQRSRIGRSVIGGRYALKPPSAQEFQRDEARDNHSGEQQRVEGQPLLNLAEDHWPEVFQHRRLGEEAPKVEDAPAAEAAPAEEPVIEETPVVEAAPEAEAAAPEAPADEAPAASEEKGEE